MFFFEIGIAVKKVKRVHRLRNCRIAAIPSKDGGRLVLRSQLVRKV
jgi:chemotaxis signal transduction protein